MFCGKSPSDREAGIDINIIRIINSPVICINISTPSKTVDITPVHAGIGAGGSLLVVLRTEMVMMIILSVSNNSKSAIEHPHGVNS